MPTKMWATIKFDQTLREREKERERERGISPDLVVVTSETQIMGRAERKGGEKHISHTRRSMKPTLELRSAKPIHGANIKVEY